MTKTFVILAGLLFFTASIYLGIDEKLEQVDPGSSANTEQAASDNTMHNSSVETLDNVTFSGGAPLDGYLPRITVPLLTEAFKRNNIKFNAEYYPSLRSLMLSNSGETQGELHRVYSFHNVSGGKYPNLIRIESKLLSVWVVAFASKEINVKSWNDLKEYRVGYFAGRKNIESMLNGVLSPKQITTTTTDLQAFMMLAADRIDIVISDSVQGNNIVAHYPKLSTISEIAKLDEAKIYAYAHKSLGRVVPEIARTLEEMKEDGTFQEIVLKVNEEFR